MEKVRRQHLRNLLYVLLLAAVRELFIQELIALKNLLFLFIWKFIIFENVLFLFTY